MLHLAGTRYCHEDTLTLGIERICRQLSGDPGTMPFTVTVALLTPTTTLVAGASARARTSRHPRNPQCFLIRT